MTPFGNTMIEKVSRGKDNILPGKVLGIDKCLEVQGEQRKISERR